MASFFNIRKLTQFIVAGFLAQGTLFLHLQAMELQSKCQRIKTLEHVTAHGLESALEKGLQIVLCLHYHSVIYHRVVFL